MGPNADNNTIENNFFQNNTRFGIGLSRYSGYNVIINNIISGSSVISGIFLGQSIMTEVPYTHNNIITKNTIINNTGYFGGISLWGSYDNIIFKNNISNNSPYGIYVINHKKCESINNLFYANNFYANENNAYDNSTNNWYNESIKYGNYWDDYTGEDNNEDGIGDKPYIITGKDNEDVYPLITAYLNNQPNKPNRPSGETSGKAGEVYNYTTTSSDVDDDLIWFKWDWGDETSGWIGPYDPGDICKANHIWDNKGEYTVQVKAKDIYGDESPWSDSLEVSIPKTKKYNQISRIIVWFSELFPFL